MNPKYIDINAYKKWRDGLRREFERDYANYLEELRIWRDGDSIHAPNIRAPREPDWSLQTYIEHLIDSMPNQGH